ncbi:hypothetical protein ZIOFF_001622 [Zingiber officinale]|uniref:Transposase-associated domain-containing protein n=1 Tax=Zingiber officinale TaxID=94328 RepID=A0A8J5LS94_ZINOF|nr:hypothetical protein ZIOFF_001622 [Zingiber officinale]
MDWPRASLGYRVGILNFLRFAFVDLADEVKKPCACRKCINSSNHECPTMHEHLTIYGMLQDYRIWDFHGEKPMVQSRDSMCSVLHASSRENNDEDNHNMVVQEMLCYAFRIHEEPFTNNENNIDGVKSTSGKASRKSALATDGVKKRHCFFPSAEGEIRKYQTNMELLFRKLSFQRLLRLHCSIPCGRKDPCPCYAGIGNASDDIHDIAMAEDELSDDDMQAGEEEAVITK